MANEELIERFPERVVIYDDGSTRISAIGWSKWDLIVTMDASDGSKVVFDEVPLGPFMNHAPWFFYNLKDDVMEELFLRRPEGVMSFSNAKTDELSGS